MNTYWLIGNKNYSVQNDSLVCHWNPNLSRKKKTAIGSNVSVANVSIGILKNYCVKVYAMLHVIYNIAQIQVRAQVNFSLDSTKASVPLMKLDNTRWT